MAVCARLFFFRRSVVRGGQCSVKTGRRRRRRRPEMGEGGGRGPLSLSENALLSRGGCGGGIRAVIMFQKCLFPSSLARMGRVPCLRRAGE